MQKLLNSTLLNDDFRLGVLTSSLFYLIIIFISVDDGEQKYNKGRSDALNECDYDYLLIENNKLKFELNKWYDHVHRMKLICGVPNSDEWSYKNKIRYNIDLKTLEQWKN